MPVLGADPDKVHSEWDEFDTGSPKKVYVRPAVARLTNYFAYHPMSRMSDVCGEKEKLMLHRLFARRLAQKFTATELEKMVDRFYAAHQGDTDYPAQHFCSNKMQEELVALADVTSDDPYLAWLLDGMPDNPCPDDLRPVAKELRSSVLRTLHIALLTYPDEVANVLRVTAGDPAFIHARLLDLEDMLKMKYEGITSTMFASGLNKYLLDPDLVFASKSQLRPMRSSPRYAIAALPHKSKHELEW